MNRRFQYYFVIFILFILLMISFAKDYHGTGINEYAYVLAIGIDKGQNQNLKLTLQVADPTATATSIGSNNGSSENSSSVINTIECSSINSGINWFNTYLGKTVNLSHCKAIIFSEELATNGISQYIYTLMNNIQFRETANVIVSQTTSEDFLNNYKPPLEKLSANYYESIPTSNDYTSYTQNITINDFFNTYIDTCASPVAILGSKNNQGSIGIALFKEDKYIGKLNTSETICHMLMINELKRSEIHVPNPLEEDKYLDIIIKSNSSTKKHVKLVNGTPIIKVSVSLNGELASMTEGISVTNENEVNKIKDYIEVYIKNIITNYLYNTSKQYKSDIDGFGKCAISNFSTWQKWIDYNWLEQYQNAFFDVNVNFNLKSSQLILESKK